MSTESTRAFTDLAFTDLVTHPAAAEIAASVAKQVVVKATVELRRIARSMATEAYPYSSFEHGGVRRFDRPAAPPPRFRIS